MMSFSQLPLHEQILQAVAEAGYTQPTPIQEQVIGKVSRGADVIGIAQTGTGKTAAFTLPLLSKMVDNINEATAANKPRHLRLLIMAPTRELVQQIHDNIVIYAQFTDIRCGAIYGGVSDKSQIAKLNSGVDVIVATPGRLLDLVNRHHGNFGQVDALVLDEADRMLDMGFIPGIKVIVSKLPKRKQTLLFSATMNSQIELLTKEFLNSPTLVEAERRASPVEGIDQSVYEIAEHQKTELLKALLESSHEFYAVMVFARTKAVVEQLNLDLKEAGITSTAIYGDKSQGQRKRALDEFKNGKVQVLVATDVAARGIDVEGVTHVINYDFPDQTEDYVHRIGRTGRAKASGVAITFITKANGQALNRVEKLIGKTLPRKNFAGFRYEKDSLEERPFPKTASKPRYHQNEFSNNKNQPKSSKPSSNKFPRRKR